MDPFKVKNHKDGPESIIQKDIIVMLKDRGWEVIVTHGNIYQHGLPDLYCMHAIYGTRWIEVKNPEKYSFTPAQKKMFPIFDSKNVGIFVLTAATKQQYDLLFGPANWWMFMGKSSMMPTVKLSDRIEDAEDNSPRWKFLEKDDL